MRLLMLKARHVLMCFVATPEFSLALKATKRRCLVSKSARVVEGVTGGEQGPQEQPSKGLSQKLNLHLLRQLGRLKGKCWKFLKGSELIPSGGEQDNLPS